ncbi:MAG: rhodanese-like domain-containing protein, partial [Rectinema sp.]|nr:rhodanese-like domain-containing protein [Rectinema sp.]
KEEFEEEHYPGARCIPVDQIAQHAETIGPKDKPVILYCASGARSAYAARILKMLGFQKVINAGGLYDMPNF